MKAKISIILSDDSCRELLTNFGLKTAEKLEAVLQKCFDDAGAGELSGDDEIKVEVEE